MQKQYCGKIRGLTKGAKVLDGQVVLKCIFFNGWLYVYCRTHLKIQGVLDLLSIRAHRKIHCAMDPRVGAVRREPWMSFFFLKQRAQAWVHWAKFILQSRENCYGHSRRSIVFFFLNICTILNLVIGIFRENGIGAVMIFANLVHAFMYYSTFDFVDR